MFKQLIGLFCWLYFVESRPSNATFKNQFCTDPRTMRRHAVNTEWADAYSCTRHRCQPGGRNLAIYTVGCKRVEAPESAIECEEVVEDTNMQFPYCCTRLRCLVVVRGEVWTRVLGQPWETLPAAPWSHMYKMKRPPPGDNMRVPKSTVDGPVYELLPETPVLDAQETQDNTEGDGSKGSHSSLRTSKKDDHKNCKDHPKLPTPDFVAEQLHTTTSDARMDASIALTTDEKDNDKKMKTDNEASKQTVARAPSKPVELDENEEIEKLEEELEESRQTPEAMEQLQEPHGEALTEIPRNEWIESEPSVRSPAELPKDAEKPTSEPSPTVLQALVDAIGTRMRDIEDVVQRMSTQVSQGKVSEQEEYRSAEKTRILSAESFKEGPSEMNLPKKKANVDGENYKRFSVKTRSGSKYLRVPDVDMTPEEPLYLEDNEHGYYQDASNSLLRRSDSKEPKLPIYMAPIDATRKNSNILEAEETERRKKKKHKKHRPKSGRRPKKNKRKDKKRSESSSELETNSPNKIDTFEDIANK